MFGHILFSCSGFEDAETGEEIKVRFEDRVTAEFKHVSSSRSFRFFDLSWALGAVTYRRMFHVVTTRSTSDTGGVGRMLGRRVSQLRQLGLWSIVLPGQLSLSGVKKPQFEVVSHHIALSTSG